VLAPISWGTTYVTVTELLPAGRPLLVAAGRVVPAGAILALYGWRRSRWRPRGAELRSTCILALFNFGIFFPLLIVAVYRLPGGVAAAVGGVQPLLVAMLTWILSRRAPRLVDVLAGVAAAAGVGLVVVRPGAGIDPVGVSAAVGANVSFSLGVVLTKRFPPPTHRLAATGWQLLASGAILVPLAVVAEGSPPPLSASSVAGFAYLSLAATGAAFALWFHGIAHLPTAAPPLLGLAAPLTGAAAGWLLLDEALSTSQLLGFAITVTAIAYGASLQERAADLNQAPVAQQVHSPAGEGGDGRALILVSGASTAEGSVILRQQGRLPPAIGEPHDARDHEAPDLADDRPLAPRRRVR
jgi:probable blue pigment (indigoidine) exporter